MNIREAKEEIKKTVRAYTAKTPSGNYRIPQKRQRPVLLIGPPGIGKTAIMEQVAAECGLGLVSYTMTHHTRQSAVGLPRLETRIFENQEYTITAYTMSEIIASVYEQMERTGRKEGILFLDEINCVSETLMPAMLQFLQYKTFGSHPLPEGWVIVAAGNPASYNRSVREFDTVTLDRVKRMDVEPDLPIWKQYALEQGLHPAVLSFLELKPECFYILGQDRTEFVTGRGWEDLSEMLLTLEDLDLKVEDLLFGQYLQEKETAREFAFYYRLYEKWKERLKPEWILTGVPKETGKELPGLSFAERLCILSLLQRRLCRLSEDSGKQEDLVQSLSYFCQGLEQGKGASWEAALTQLGRRQQAQAVKKEYGLLSAKEEEEEKQLEECVRSCVQEIKLQGREDVFEKRLEKEREEAELLQEEAASAIQSCVDFVKETFGEGQELIILLTGLLEYPPSKRLIRERLPRIAQWGDAFLNVDRRAELLRKGLEKQENLKTEG